MIRNFTNCIQEKDDVYFECRIVSNPEATKLEWYHEVKFLYKLYFIAFVHICQEHRLLPNASGGILLSNQSLVIQVIFHQRKVQKTEYQSRELILVLQGVEKKHNGAYTCRAENSQGEATSNTINLSIKCKISGLHKVWTIIPSFLLLMTFSDAN